MPTYYVNLDIVKTTLDGTLYEAAKAEIEYKYGKHALDEHGRGLLVLSEAEADDLRRRFHNERYVGIVDALSLEEMHMRFITKEVVQNVARITIMLPRKLLEAILECENDVSTFLALQAAKDERVAAFLAQSGKCKYNGCQRDIYGDEDVYCGVHSDNGMCPAWFCREHYALVHFSDE